VCYAEIENRFHNPVGSAAIEIFNFHPKKSSTIRWAVTSLVSDIISGCVRKHAVVCWRSPFGVVRLSKVAYHFIDLSVWMAASRWCRMSIALSRTYSETSTSVVHGFCCILLHPNRTTQRILAYVALTCKPQKMIVILRFKRQEAQLTPRDGTFLPIATQQYKNYLHDKSWTNRSWRVTRSNHFHRPRMYTDDLLWRNFLSPQCRNDPDHVCVQNLKSRAWSSARRLGLATINLQTKFEVSNYTRYVQIWVAQGHQQCHHSIERIWLPIRL